MTQGQLILSWGKVEELNNLLSALPASRSAACEMPNTHSVSNNHVSGMKPFWNVNQTRRLVLNLFKVWTCENVNKCDKGYLPLSFPKVLNLFSLAADASQHLRQDTAVDTPLVSPIFLLHKRCD